MTADHREHTYTARAELYLTSGGGGEYRTDAVSGLVRVTHVAG